MAFGAWTAVLNVAEGAALESLIAQTFIVIVQKWANFDSATQKSAHEVIAGLLRDYSSLIQGIIDVLPSLASIPLMSKFESQLVKYKPYGNVSSMLWSFVERCKDENSLVVLQALYELLPYLEQHQTWIHETAALEQPHTVVAELIRSLLDTTDRFNNSPSDLARLSAQCLGVIGCVDPNRIESVKEAHLLLVQSNFKNAKDAIGFVVHFLEHVLVKAFQAATNPRAQGFLAYVMQELLKFCGFSKDAFAAYRPHGSQGDEVYQRWKIIPDATKQVLTPFLSSHYVLKTNSNSMVADKPHPIYRGTVTHSVWLRELVLTAFHNAKGENARMIFDRMARIIRGCDISIVSMLLPYALANIILDGSQDEALGVGEELLAVLQQPADPLTGPQVSQLELCSQDVFKVLDYLSKWLQHKKKALNTTRSALERSGRMMDQLEAEQERADLQQIANVEAVLQSIPSEVISQRAAACGSYARAILHWEAHMRERAKSHEGKIEKIPPAEREQLYQRLQDIYTDIDEPDGIAGVSTHLHILDPEQQAIEHRKAGRWSAAQSWYSLILIKEPGDIWTHIKSLSCLREASQFASILRQAESAPTAVAQNSTIQSIVAEAAWSANDWRWFDEQTKNRRQTHGTGFNHCVGLVLKALRDGDVETFSTKLEEVRLDVTKGLRGSAALSVQSSRDHLLKLHALYELELVSGVRQISGDVPMSQLLTRRLDTLGSSQQDKQFLLSLRRAVVQAGNRNETYSLASSWIATAKLARKSEHLSLAYTAVYNASVLGDEYAKIEQARLLWDEGEHRRAVQSLEGAMVTNAFAAAAGTMATSDGPGNPTAGDASVLTSMTANEDPNGQAQQNLLTAKAQLLRAKWLDESGQTSSEAVLGHYRQVTFSYQKWEKGLYSLGKFYNKLLDSERSLPLGRQNQRTLNGETVKLVVENYLRSLTFGCKYINESLPKLLTLWLDLGAEASRQVSKEVTTEVREKVNQTRPKFLEGINKQIKKYSDKISPFVFYTALTQMITRISHEHPTVWNVLSLLIVKVISTYPQQALWFLLGTVKSTAKERHQRGKILLERIQQTGRKIRSDANDMSLQELVTKAQKLSDELLRACEVAIPGRSSKVSLQKELGFKPRVAPCPLVIPWERTLKARLPKTNGSRAMRNNKAFSESREAVTILSFEDDVLVLSSLQKPRKLTVKGTDGHYYGLLCKPNDDLRKDQRLMEYNAIINRGLKKDATSAARRLYIKTYAVTPLNERCGIIEWVEGLKPLRDILIALYRAKGVKIDYNLLRNLLNEACANPPATIDLFTNQLLSMYFPILHEWFMENFAAPDAWYAARTRYSRSAAVASIVGHSLGLGDRHGENVLLQEESGSVFHVDFNCLFDKGLTFEKPELVPFRLTHNMIDAMGATGVEGYFRKAAEVTLAVMRTREDALLTILETFVYDPTADFVNKGPKAPRVVKVPGLTSGLGFNQTIPESPKEVLECTRWKLKGLLPGETLPLNVQGYVDALIGMAKDPERLARMYIGWCAFL